MSIIPFKDKPEVDPGAEVIVITGSAGINTTGYDTNGKIISEFEFTWSFRLKNNK